MAYYLKHQMSCLPDLNFEVSVDEEAKVVRVEAPTFDSSFIAWLVTTILPAELGVVAFRDDNQAKGREVWFTPRAPYKLRVAFCGHEYHAEVVRMFGDRNITVALNGVVAA